MVREMLEYAKNLCDWPMNWDKDINRDSYIRAAKSKATCRGRKKKRNMNHVSRLTKSKHRRRLK